MLEIFSYTERVVNMARPRKVLMMAIGGFSSVSGKINVRLLWLTVNLPFQMG